MNGRRSLLCVGAATALLSIFLFVEGPSYGGASFGTEQLHVWEIVSWIGPAMAVFGLSWMVRIYRRDPEAGPSSWRFHKWD